ncbi:MAG: response regulator [Deltaproteobacteria bacterium]|nr:response regulator [Deltaproteobacteria bacterium]
MKKKILVVDDEKDVVEFYRDLLEDNGYEVSSAYDGLKAMELVKKDKPDLILLDLQMPEETGTGFYRKLHNKTDLKDIPVIIISGLAGRNLAVSKSVVVIDKPPKEQEILEEVRRSLGE